MLHMSMEYSHSMDEKETWQTPTQINFVLYDIAFMSQGLQQRVWLVLI
jgi:hypothetical protein